MTRASNGGAGYRFRFLWMAVVVLTAAAVQLSAARSATGGRQPDAVLIQKYMWLSGEEASLIVEREELDRLADLLLENPKSGIHACGYHWLIWFRFPDGSLEAVAHNEECEEYSRRNRRVHSTLGRQFDRIRRAPPNFILNLDVPVRYAPSELQRILDSPERRVFAIDGGVERLPRVDIRAVARSQIPEQREAWKEAEDSNQKSADDALAGAVAEIREELPVHSTAPVKYPSRSFGGSRIETIAQVTVYFSLGTSLEQLPDLSGTLEYRNPDEPASYSALLAVGGGFSEELRALLMSEFPFLLHVERLPASELEDGESGRPDERGQPK